jgi:iron(III) transport system permease protein
LPVATGGGHTPGVSQPLARLVFGLAVLFFAAFLFWPLAQILRGGFVDADGRLSAATLEAVLSDPTYLRALRNSFLLACAATALALLLAVPLAVLFERYRFPGRGALASLLLLPLILPPFVGAIGIRQLLGRYGALNALLVALHLRPAGWTFDWLGADRFWGVALVEALSLYPVIYLNAAAALANLDPALEEAAENLGCTGLRRFRRITLPLIRPGLFAGGTIVFIWVFTDLGTPLIFDYSRVTSVQIYNGLADLGGNPFPYALVAVMLAASLLLYAVGRGLFGRSAPAQVARAGPAAQARALAPGRAWLGTAAAAAVAALALLPHLGVILVAFSRDWYGSVLPRSWTLANFHLALGHPLTVPAIANSLRYSALATALDLVLGVALAAVIARSRLPGRRLLDACAMLPLAVPGLVLAFGFLAMAQPGRLFAFLNPVENPAALLVIAYALRRLPYVVRAAVAGFGQVSETLEEAAQSLGCPPLRALRRITLPLISANLIAGALLAFAFAVLEVSDSLILAQKQAFYPITKAILELYQLLGEGKFLASALGVWTMAFLGAVVAGLGVLLGRRLGASFRV